MTLCTVSVVWTFEGLEKQKNVDLTDENDEETGRISYCWRGKVFHFLRKDGAELIL